MVATPVSRVLSGIQPTSSSFHLGNYIGAVKQWVALQDGHEVFYFLADLHSLTVDPPAPDVLTERSRRAAAQLLAAGVDPDRSAVFLQSHVPGHTRLAWILECLTGYGEAGRMTQFKDKTARGGADRGRVGVVTYPILQAGAIIIHPANSVALGADQRPHLQLDPDLAPQL